jgi:hypothetical protein
MKTKMKTIIVLLLALVSLNTQAQTCLFRSMHFADPSRSVGDFIKSYHQFIGSTFQDVRSDGPAPEKLTRTIDFISSEFETSDISKIGLIPALDSGFQIMATVQFADEDGNIFQHEIVIHSYRSKDRMNAAQTFLRYYDPATGRKDEEILMNDFFRSKQLYSVAVKPKKTILWYTHS